MNHEPLTIKNYSLHLEPRFSKRFAIILTIQYCGALLCLLALTLPLTAQLALCVKFCIGFLVLASTFFTIRRDLLLINHPLYGCVLVYDEDTNDIKVQLQSKTKAKIAPGSYSHPQLIVLRLKHQEKSQTDALVIFPDALDIQTFRQLRVFIRHSCDQLP
ncbi:MAG: hypothetical protein DRQ49_06285 [Gammaproteobacteria bacterium]|nr:MAG: hypothetical protein DRQ49_06285 [Gammaproteobacteria bacterium]RKZ42236.1 MAG: hypothetical protein DRQ41_07240 [Gammaproteobacteria bacterium]RKZ75885.1 MAG: hypothetical protein DRQ57_05865 [Gammaproteobacteria bacterium]